MVSMYEKAGFNGRTTNTYVCLDADARPTKCGNGDKMIVMDTGALEFFDAMGEQWVAFGGGGGSSSSQTLDFGGADLEIDNTVLVDGIYDACEALDPSKPTIISGLNIDGEEFPAFYALVDGDVSFMFAPHVIAVRRRYADVDGTNVLTTLLVGVYADDTVVCKLFGITSAE